MPVQDFSAFFSQATGHQPYPYQHSVAHALIKSRLIHVAAGCGKTAPIAFLHRWNRTSVSKSPQLMTGHCSPALRTGGDR